MTVSSSLTSITSLMTAGLFVSVSFGSASIAKASDGPPPVVPNQDPYFTIQSVSIEELPDNVDEDYLQGLLPPPTGGIGTMPPAQVPTTGNTGSSNPGSIIGDIGQVTGAINSIVNTGKLIWAIIEANKAVVNVSTDVANAIPQASTTWDNLQGWSAPQTHLFHITYQNGFGKDVIDFTYRVIYLFGGNVDGKGQFLNGVSIVPANLSVAWGYTFTAKANVPSVTNAGSKNDPIAAMQLQMQWSVSTVLSNNERTQNYYIRGDGQFSELK